MSDGEGDYVADLVADASLDYGLEEYDVGPTEQQVEAQETSQIDFRMDAPPPERSMENRLRDASEAAPPQGLMPGRSCCPSGGGSSNTGPKAVKADFEAAKQVLRNQRLMQRLRHERALQGQQRVDLSAMALPPEQKQAQKKPHRRGSDDDSDSDSEMDEAFERYKQQRIQFVQNTLPRFGEHTRVSKLEFADIVKNVHELVYVVCHLYQNNVEACVRLNLCFESLAPQFPHVRFCRLRSTEARAGFKAAGLPALLVYRGGQMLTSALRVTDVLPREFGDIDVAKLLQAKGILSVPTGLADNSSRLLASRTAELSDDDDDAAGGDEAEGDLGLFGDLRIAGASGSSSSAAAGRSAAAGSKLQRGRIVNTRGRGYSDDSDSD